MTQAEVAQRAGLDLRTVTRIERVEREPSISTLVRIARGLNLPVAELLREIR